MASSDVAPELTPLDQLSDHLLLARQVAEAQGMNSIRNLIDMALTEILFTSQSYGDVGPSSSTLVGPEPEGCPRKPLLN